LHGAIFEEVPYGELLRLKLDGGVLLKTINEGKWKEAGIKEDFVIAFIDKVSVDNLVDFNRILDYKQGGMLVEGFYLNGDKGTYGVEW